MTPYGRRVTSPRHTIAAVAAVGLLVVLVGCGSDAPGVSEASEPVRADPATAARHADGVRLVDSRLDQVQVALDGWRDATSLEAARRGAEIVRNLVTGPGVREYGDLDADGSLGGATDQGLLPGEDGGPGLATALSDCAGVDLLGGPWTDPTARWDELRGMIAAWTPADNPFPTLPSHPQRVVGWAQLTLDTDSLDEAHEYAGHAQLHVDAARAAVLGCG